MKVIENISPYIIIEENGLYGIADRNGNYVVPCIMDEISNDKNEEHDIDCWEDFFCVPILKDGKYGFFTRNGKFIEPKYDRFCLDPCGGDIHVKTEKGFGIYASPEYTLEEIPENFSILSDIYNDEDDVFFNEDIIDSEHE